MPHDMHTMRGPKAGTGIASPSASLSTIPCPPLCLDQPFTDGDSDRLSPVYRAEQHGISKTSIFAALAGNVAVGAVKLFAFF
jgi:hypothetical protein